MDPVHHHVVRDNKNKTPMLDSVFILVYILTQKMDTVYEVNDIKCDIQVDIIIRELLKNLPKYHCFCKTFLWRKHALDRSTDPWVLK